MESGSKGYSIHIDTKSRGCSEVYTRFFISKSLAQPYTSASCFPNTPHILLQNHLCSFLDSLYQD